MKVVSEHRWENFLRCFPEGDKVIAYAQRWAEQMEYEIEKGVGVPAIAERTSLETQSDDDIQACFAHVIFILSTFWVHRKELKVWYEGRKVAYYVH